MMKYCKILTVLAVVLASATVFGQNPLWDLKTDKLDKSLVKGDVAVLEDGSVKLPENATFAVPASAFPDQKNFTVKLKIKYPKIEARSVCANLLKKEGKTDSGFGLSLGRNIYNEGYTPRVNLMYASQKVFAGNNGRASADKPVEFTVFAREGIVSFYMNDIAGPKIFASPIACDEPMWVGDGRKNFGEIEVLDLKVYGAEYQYKSPLEKSEKEPRGVRIGKGWNLSVPTETDANRPRILVYGDSISMGYCPILTAALNGSVYVEHWIHFAGSPKMNWKIYEDVAKSSPFSVIVFNNGLHSTHWTPEKVSDDEIYASYKNIVEGFRKGAPQAVLIYLNTTPVNDGGEKGNRKLDKRNDVVVRMNKIAAQVMKDEGVEVIDMYAVLLPRIDEMSRDRFHWERTGYRTIAETVGKKVAEVLKKNGKPID